MAAKLFQEYVASLLLSHDACATTAAQPSKTLCASTTDLNIARLPHPASSAAAAQPCRGRNDENQSARALPLALNLRRRACREMAVRRPWQCLARTSHWAATAQLDSGRGATTQCQFPEYAPRTLQRSRDRVEAARWHVHRRLPKRSSAAAAQSNGGRGTASSSASFSMQRIPRFAHAHSPTSTQHGDRPRCVFCVSPLRDIALQDMLSRVMRMDVQCVRP